MSSLGDLSRRKIKLDLLRRRKLERPCNCDDDDGLDEDVDEKDNDDDVDFLRIASLESNRR